MRNGRRFADRWLNFNIPLPACILLCVIIIATALLGARIGRSQVYSVVGMSGTPTVSSCGAGASVAGTDATGVISIGTGLISACTLNFGSTLPNAPMCVATSSSVLATVGNTSVSTGAVNFGLSVSLGGGKIYYICSIA